ncbi:unnamed protein product [Clonostachys rosea f. rosea IK726]|uniref:Peptidase S1 domain-containing protein n=2 Tax=Bionectria ochroleuca TaxID=29856 RepID=A0A0B7KDH3_BIOOC|nr:unnamed protein product [Clonostachys rosea f. rosea IK726]
MVSVRSLAASILPLASMAAALPLEDGGVSINIVGGTTATISEFPYIVSLTEGGSHFCGGVLLNANTVLTAGHCSEGVRASAVKVRAGTATWASGGKQVAVSSIKIHSSYTVKDDIPYNDIAIWKLSSTIAESSTIKYAALPAQGSDPSAGTSVTVAGWGLTTETGTSVVSALRKVTVSVVSRATCRSQYGTSSISDVMWCAGATAGGKDACSGDSGGPIVKSSGTLLGIVSWVNGCARKGYAGVYTRVGSFIDWINTNKA